MPSEKDKRRVNVLFIDWQREKSKNKKRFEEDVQRKKERKKDGLPCYRHKTMDYEDKEWPIEHSRERNKEKLTVDETQQQKKERKKIKRKEREK